MSRPSLDTEEDLAEARHVLVEVRDALCAIDAKLDRLLAHLEHAGTIVPVTLLPEAVSFMADLSPRSEDWELLPEEVALVAALTPREDEVWGLIATSHTAKAMARIMGTSVKTVESQRAALYDRLHVRDVAALVRLAVRARRIRL